MDSNLLNERHTLKNKLQFKSLRTVVATDIVIASLPPTAVNVPHDTCWRVLAGRMGLREAPFGVRYGFNVTVRVCDW